MTESVRRKRGTPYEPIQWLPDLIVNCEKLPRGDSTPSSHTCWINFWQWATGGPLEG